jgi:regulator of RNase E activity RraA
MSVIAALHQGATGDVLVVAAGAADLAVAGELFATEAVRRGLAGIVIDGLCRDTRTLARGRLPVFARGVTPRAAPAQAIPVVQVPLTIGGVAVRPGDIIVGDDDGILVADVNELEAVIDVAEGIQFREEAHLTSMADGMSLFDKLNFEEHIENLRAGRESKLLFSD